MYISLLKSPSMLRPLRYLCCLFLGSLVKAKRNGSTHVAVIYRSPANELESSSAPGSGIKVNVYVDNGDIPLKAKSNNLNLPSLHSPRRYRQVRSRFSLFVKTLLCRLVFSALHLFGLWWFVYIQIGKTSN